MIAKFLKQNRRLFGKWYFVEEASLKTTAHHGIWKAIAAGKKSGREGFVFRKVDFAKDCCIAIKAGRVIEIHRNDRKNKYSVVFNQVPVWSSDDTTKPIIFFKKDDSVIIPTTNFLQLPVRFKTDVKKRFHDRAWMMLFVSNPMSLSNMRPSRRTDTCIRKLSPTMFTEVVQHCNENGFSWACPSQREGNIDQYTLPSSLYVDETEVNPTILQLVVSGVLEIDE